MPTIDLSFAQDPNILALALFFGMVPAMLWLVFWLKARGERSEGTGALTFLFAAGALAACTALPVEHALGQLTSDPYAVTLLWASAEEVLKFLALLAVLVAGVSVEKPVEYALYAIVVGLGFAGLENALYFLEPLRTGNVTVITLAGSTRFLGSTLMHAVSAGLAGAALGFAFYKPLHTKRSAAIVGLVGAALLHGTYNIWMVRNGGQEFFSVFIFLWIVAIVMLIVYGRLHRMGDSLHSSEARSAPLKALERAAKECYLSIGSSPLDERPMRETLMAKFPSADAPEQARWRGLLSELRFAYGAYLASQGASDADAARASLTVIPDTISPKAAEGIIGVLVRASEGESLPTAN